MYIYICASRCMIYQRSYRDVPWCPARRPEVWPWRGNEGRVRGEGRIFLGIPTVIAMFHVELGIFLIFRANSHTSCWIQSCSCTSKKRHKHAPWSFLCQMGGPCSLFREHFVHLPGHCYTLFWFMFFEGCSLSFCRLSFSSRWLVHYCWSTPFWTPLKRGLCGLIWYISKPWSPQKREGCTESEHFWSWNCSGDVTMYRNNSESCSCELFLFLGLAPHDCT